MSIIVSVMGWVKDKLIAANEDGIPIPLIRDQHMDRGSLPGTMFFVSFNVALITLVGKLTKYLGDVDYSNVLWLLGVTGSFWAIEALGKKISIGKDKIEVDGGPEETK